MKKIVTRVLSCGLAAALMVGASTVSAATIAQWTFETAPPADATDSTTIGPILADSGLGTASGLHALAATDWTTPAGNGSANSLSANTWSTGDYYQFSVSTLLYTSISIGFDQTRSGTGPNDFKIQADFGSGFVDVGLPYDVLQVTWASGAPVPSAYGPFSLPAAADGLLTLPIRVVSLDTTAAAGTNRIDNVVISGTLVPEPASIGTALCGLLGVVALRRRHA
jgi:hypothetical protein